MYLKTISILIKQQTSAGYSTPAMSSLVVCWGDMTCNNLVTEMIHTLHMSIYTDTQTHSTGMSYCFSALTINIESILSTSKPHRRRQKQKGSNKIITVHVHYVNFFIQST